jgi:hypothetical protein
MGDEPQSLKLKTSLKRERKDRKKPLINQELMPLRRPESNTT